MNIKELNQELTRARDNYTQSQKMVYRAEVAQTSILAAWHNIKQSAQDINFDLRDANEIVIQPMLNELNDMLNDLKEKAKSARLTYNELNESYQAKREQIEAERQAEAERIERERAEQAISSLSTEQLRELVRQRGLLV